MFHSIQACRAFAALLVVFFHTGGVLAKAKYFGSQAEAIDKIFWFGGEAGVAFFFVLSGFIITYVHSCDLDRPNKLVGYLRKRAFRIYPTYVIIFLVVYLSALLFPQIRNQPPLDLSVFAKSLLLIPQDKLVIGGTGAPIIIVAWSLQYEIVFYAAFAFGILNRRLYYALWLAFGISLIGTFILDPYPFPLNFLSGHLILLFGMGAMAAVAARSKIPLSNAGVVAACAVGAFFIVAAIVSYHRADNVKQVSDIVYGVVSSVIIFSLVRYETGRQTKIRLEVLSLLGGSSYALYLIHLPLLSIICKLAVHVIPKTLPGAWVAFTLITSVCVIVAILFHKLIEKPILRRLTPASRIAIGA